MAIQPSGLHPAGEAAGFPVEATKDDDTSQPPRKSLTGPGLRKVACLVRVCVVGAGPSGLTALKALAHGGLTVECFEQADRIGGLWALHVRIGDDVGKTSAYHSLHINTSRERTQFSDFPMPAHYPDYPAHTQVCAYLEQYAEHFALTESIRLNTAVAQVAPHDGEGYVVTLASGAKLSYDAVVVANGHHADPYWPELPGHFDGALIHARDYLDPDHPVQLRGRRVVVVGFGNSAVDIAAELAYAGADVTLSVRRGAHIIPKWVGPKPVDQSSLLPRWLPQSMRRRISQRLLEVFVGDLRAFGLPKPDHGLGHAHPTLSSEMPHLIRTRRVIPRPAIVRLGGKSAYFADGTDVEVDAIVMCTGYNVRFPFFDPNFVSAPENRLPLFLRVHKPGVPRLYFIGLCQTVGAILPIAEAQSRWVAAELRGEYRLPSEAEMWQAIDEHDRSTSGYVPTRRHTMQIDPERYLSALARELRRGRARARKAR